MFLRNMRAISKSKSNNKTTILPATEDRSWPGLALLASYGGGSFAYHTETQSIAYTVRDPARPGAANFCIHKHDVADYPYSGPISVPHHTPSAPTQVTYDTTYTSWMVAAHSVGVGAAKAALGGNLREAVLGVSGSSYILSGYDKMRPDLTEVSLPNFLWDITQLKSLVDLWSSRRSVLQNIGNANLNYNFGWRPTVSDSQGIVNGVFNLWQKIRNWNNSLGTTVTKRCTVYDNSVSKSGTVAGSPHARFTTNYRGMFNQRVTAHIVYRPLPLREMRYAERLLRGYLDSLGFELRAGIVWDAIPFSFIVDWFLPIGDLLNQIGVDTLELPVKLEDSYLQYKELALFDTWVKDNGDGNYPARALPGSSSTEKFFQRMLILPRFEDWPTLGWRSPNLKQLTYALSLSLK
jgi:hypothetical protein